MSIDMFNNQNFTENLQKMFNQDWIKNFSNNNFDAQNMMKLCRKNAENFTNLNKVNSDNAQALMRRSFEVSQDLTNKALDNMQDMTTVSNPQAFMMKQQNFAKNYCESIMANSREYMEMLSKSTMEVVDAFNKNFAQNFAECQTGLAQSCATESSKKK